MMIKCNHHEMNVIRLKYYCRQIDMTNSFWFSPRPTINIIFLLKIAKQFYNIFTNYLYGDCLLISEKMMLIVGLYENQ